MQSAAIAAQYQLLLLQNALQGLEAEVFSKPSRYLSGSSIGQHTRHIIELFQCLLAGYENGLVNYDARQRDPLIESSPTYALQLLANLSQRLELADKQMQLSGNFSVEDDSSLTVATTYLRELVYNLEHTIHHMALIRVAFNEFSLSVSNEHFGVAFATVKHREACAQ